MKRVTFGAFLAVALSTAFSAEPAKPKPVAESFSFGGVDRRALVYTGASPARGLVLLLHGHAGNADQLLGERFGRAPYRVFIRIAEREGWVVVAPDGLAGGDGRRGWNDCRLSSTNPSSDDAGFLEELVTRVAARHGVEKGRWFVAGTSNGGEMVIRLALEKPRLFRAFAAVVAEMPAKSRCAAPMLGVPILFMNGTADPFMPWNGGTVAGEGSGRGAVLSTDRTVDLFRKLNGATGEPVVEPLPDLDTKDGSRVIRSTWKPAKGGAPVVLYRVDGGGHVEPSTAERYRGLVTAVLGRQNGDIEMADEIFRFFLSQLASPPRGH
ncbi:MAG TPA: PHB depolymerase family esterase [Thermoanaerobaculia bacterium]|nr:PHB depolymerase family esterase [Thermoanaerobaculia bacterium]